MKKALVVVFVVLLLGSFSYFYDGLYGEGDSSSDVVVSSDTVVVAPYTDELSIDEGYTFSEVFDQIHAFDEELGASYREEHITKHVVPTAVIDQYLIVLEELENAVNDHESEDKDPSLRLIDARKHMLLGQKAYNTAKAIGHKGLVANVSAYRCEDKEAVRDAILALNDTVVLSGKATLALDELLQRYPDFRPLVGIDETRILFYRSILLDINAQRRDNQIALDVYNCFG